MGGGLMQLVAYGAQDVYLSGNPQITFFKVVYRRHTNFSVEPVQQTWNGAADFGRTVTCNINRNGDLITNMYVVVKLPNRPALTNGVEWGFVNRLGHALISNVKIEIGGSKIDEHYGDWLNIWYELTHKVGQEHGYAKMIGDVPELTTLTNKAVDQYQLYIPLQFWFNRNNGLALPLIALQYHDVRITLVFRDFNDCINYVGPTAPASSQKVSMSDSYLLIDYVYLDSEERKRFAQASHEYLIEQVQFTGSETFVNSNNKLRLNFNHPSKYLIWAPHSAVHNARNQWVSYAPTGDWEAARERFAKVIACISSDFVYDYVAAAAGLTGPVEIEIEGDAGSMGPIFESAEPVAPIVPSVELSRLRAKISARFYETAGTAVSGSAYTVGTPSAFFDNVFITKNELTFADMSVTVAQLISYLPETLRADGTALLNAWGYNVVNYHNYGINVDGSGNPCVNAKLQLNGHDRFQERDGSYFNYVQPAQHFTNTPADGINVYSFALKAEDHQPTGSCNFSRIDNATLNVNASNLAANSVLNIYVQNYNVLRVMSGMAGTAYSN
jgi:hypothetical protein